MLDPRAADDPVLLTSPSVWRRVCERPIGMAQKYNDVIAVVNSSDDTVDMLRECLNAHGFTSVVTGHVHDFKTGAEGFPDFIAQHQPAAIIYDVSIPYDRNWTFLRLLLDSESMRGRKVVVTTTNKQRLDELVGPNEAFEIVGKPYDLEQIVSAVKAALGKG